MSNIKDNIASIKKVMEEAAVRAGRNPDELLLIAVTKTRSPEEINMAIAAGITDVGENKVQEILDKYEKVDPVRWHMIGHLQTNKVKYIIDKVSLIHSVDSIRLAREIDKRAAQHNKVMDILIQVNAAEEESKFGIRTEETGQMVREILESCPNVRIRGLMSIAPFEDDPEKVRGYFKEMAELYDEYRAIEHERLDFRYLSMGMSNDFPVAIEEGANAVRIGTSIFGERNYN
ncbi:MAG: YggS family pyridoxal phosphate-dependent enzyme [Clostridiales bacterium]|nr:YggS family pyridoxal phosphate-dependent enzyme [Clostridiales bacterium]